MSTLWVFDNGCSFSDWCMYVVEADITEKQARWAGANAGCDLVCSGENAKWYDGEPDDLPGFCGLTKEGLEEAMNLAYEKDMGELHQELAVLMNALDGDELSPTDREQLLWEKEQCEKAIRELMDANR